MKAYLDDTGCCNGWKDYSKCAGKAICASKLPELKDKNDKNKFDIGPAAAILIISCL